MTLQDFLNFSFTNSIKKLYPIIGAENIRVQYISSLEPPVEKFVRENEIIFSSALSVRDNPESLFKFINDVYESHASALIFAFPNNSFQQLDSIKHYFQERNFPILTLPWDHLFSDIVEHTIKEIWNQDNGNASYLEGLQKELLNQYLSGKGLNDAAESISNYMQCDIIIVDTNHKIKGSSGKGGDMSSITDDASHSSCKFAINAGNKLYGYVLFLSDRVDSQFNPLAIEQSVITPLNLWFDKEWALTASKMKPMENFVWKLVHHEFTSNYEILSNAEVLGFNTNCLYICFLGEIGFKRRGADIYQDTPDISIHSVSNIIQEQVILAAQELALSVMTTLHKTSLIICLQKDSVSSNPDHANKYLDLLETYLSRAFPDLGIIWGYDNQNQPIINLPLSYLNAKTALNISMHSNTGQTRICFQYSIMQKILFSLCYDKETVALSYSTIEKIVKCDKSKNSDLLYTLDCFFKSNYNISETARRLHLHRQSLLYRLEKIENLCQMSLKNHNDLFILEICLMICNSTISSPLTAPSALTSLSEVNSVYRN
jgi:PucR family transcriptional regulator, purine catabolism regulatory protein